MAKNSDRIDEICACGAVKCGGEWTKSPSVVSAARCSATFIPLGVCCECGKGGVFFGGFADHSTIGCHMN